MTGFSHRDLAFLRSPIPAIIVDAGARMVDANDAYLRMTRRTREELTGAFTIDYIHADDLSATLEGATLLDAGAPSVRQRRRHLRSDGMWLEVDACSSRFELDGERFTLVQLLSVDEAPGVESAAEAQSRIQIQPFGDAACFHDAEGRITFATANLGDVLGRPVGWMLGRRICEAELHPVDTDGRPVVDDPAVEAMRRGTDLVRTIGLRNTDGQIVWFSVRVGLMHSPRLPVRSILRDVTELIRAQEEARQLATIVERELAHRADHDSLTELKARHVVIQAIGGRLDAGRDVSVVFVDVDGFKAVNDQHGHLAGDEALVAVARHLQLLAPVGATLGRNGGDEFVAVFDDAAAAERFAADVGDCVLTSPPMLPLRASVGLAHSQPGDTVRRLIQRADEAMYAAKRAGHP